MAAKHTPQAHHLQEPITGLYYTEGKDGAPALTPQPARATAFQTSGQAIAYATQYLAGQSCELVRVAA